jgi:sugar/nucleoside kinase (ribokinase family)
MKTDVVCIGSSCVDVLVRGVDLSAPFTGESKQAREVLLSVGGDATNQAIVLQKLGVSVKLVTGFGKDPASGFIQNYLQDAGVNIDRCTVSDSIKPSVNVITVAPDGQRNFIKTGTDIRSRQYPIDLESMKGAKIVSLGSLFISPFYTVESVAEVVEAARMNNALVCADIMLNPRACSLEDLKEVLPGIDYFFPNKDEAIGLTGKSDLDEIADIFLGYGIKNVIIKLGKEGCFAKNYKERVLVPAIGEKVVDTTGAGDNFVAGFIAALLEGRNLVDCCEFAAGTAGVSVQYVGANTGVRSKSQVEEFIKMHKTK